MNEPPVLSDSKKTAPVGHPDSQRKWIDNRPAIFLLLFCVTGFLGIPVLLRSRGFSATEKLVWSVIVTIYTCILIALTVWIVQWSIASIRQAIEV